MKMARNVAPSPSRWTSACAGSAVSNDSTCAGLIFLANAAGGQKEGGQVLVGGLDVRVDRNFFGAQVESFETALPAHADVQREGEGATFRAIFIRAPAIVEVSAGAGVEVL